MNQPHCQRGRVNQALILFVLFFGPVFLALFAYLGPWEIVPDRSSAYGVLMDPARPLPELIGLEDAGGLEEQDWLRSRWSVIYLSDGECGRVCRNRVAALGQIYKALADERPRVQRVFLRPEGVAPLPDVGWVDVPIAGDIPTQLRAELTAAHPGPIYVSDPLGNLVLAYSEDARDKGILKDLQRLLKLSRIG
jgi:cytochrome oxidase Cu insertion factor (SCO1/SenC/PrrC family)